MTLANVHCCTSINQKFCHWLLAPSINALQDMLTTCEEYAASHNLQFSTDPNPVKCKTNGFLRKPRQLNGLLLCGNPLPWVNQIKHLGSSLTRLMVTSLISGPRMPSTLTKTTPFAKSFTLPILKLKLNSIASSMATSQDVNSGN